MLAHDLFDWTNVGVGAAGLVLALLAIWKANGAKRAALEAREAVRERNTEDAFAEIARLAESFANWIQCERHTEAAVVGKEVTVRLARVRGEFSRFIGDEIGNVKEIEATYQRLVNLLANMNIPLDSEGKHRLFQGSFAVQQQLSEILGRIRARQEDK